MTAEPLDATATIARDLIRLNTTNWGEGRAEGEVEAAHYVEAKLTALGLTPELHESAPGRVSVLARVPGADRSKPALVVHGHLDVVPADATNWSVDPFAGEVRDGMLWGRGAVDMKNMDAMILTALRNILSTGRLPGRELIVAFFADEEAGGVLGSGWLAREKPQLFSGATEAISEVGGYSVTVRGRRCYLVQTGEKALLWVKLIARGPAAHGSRLVRENAVTKLAEAVVALGRRNWPLRLTDTTSELVSQLAALLGVDPVRTTPDEIVLATGSAAGFLSATLRTTSNPTVLTAGYKHNVIPDTASALIDVRCLAGEETATLAEVRDLVGPDIEVVVIHRDIGLETPFRGPLIDAIERSLHRYDPGAPILPYLLSGGTDNKALATLGITGYGFAPLLLPEGVDFPAMFHGVDERVPLSSLAFGTTVLTDLLLQY